MPHDQMKLDIAAKIDGEIATKQQEIDDLRALRAHVLRFDGKPNPAQADLFEGDPSGKGRNGKSRPGMKIGVATSNSNRGMFRSILRDAGRPMTAKQVWAEAVKRGAVTTSANPHNSTHGSLYAMVTKGVRKAGKGKYAYDPATAPTEEESAMFS